VIEEHAPVTKVIMMTAYAGVDVAVKSLKSGAVDFIVKPWDNAKLVATVRATCRYSQASREVKHLKAREALLDESVGREFQSIVGDSTGLKAVMQAVDKVAGTDANVLILGESGTGKEVIARAIHARSQRHSQPLVNVDLGAIADTLFEAELFGHKKGAFTDAKEDRSGRFELANGGTLFLDEIGNLSTQAQAKLLGVLESRTVSRIGSDRAVSLDVRLICATNMALADMVASYQFRSDLLYRINTVEIYLPSLRERSEDVPLLVNHYVQHFADKYKRPVSGVDDEALANLQRYHWPGNVRELKHMVERAVIMSDYPLLLAKDFSLPEPVLSSGPILNLNQLEEDAISRALMKCQGNVTKAAQALGLSRATLYRKMAKYGL
jgi:DNA-binding NtrC family response regulator